MEVLAHISARTTKKDDDRYRAQAQAYLAFEPARKVSYIEEDEQSVRAASDQQGSKRRAEDDADGHRHKVSIYQNSTDQRPRARRSISASLSSYCRRENIGASESNITTGKPAQFVSGNREETLNPPSSGSFSVSTPCPSRTPLQKLEDIQTNWRNRQRRQPGPNEIRPSTESRRNLDGPMPTDSQLDDTQIAISFLEWDVAASWSFSSGSTTSQSRILDSQENILPFTQDNSVETPGPSLVGTESFIEESIYITTGTSHQGRSSLDQPERTCSDDPHQRERNTADKVRTITEFQSAPNLSSECHKCSLPLRSDSDTEKFLAALADLHQKIESPPATPEFMKREGTESAITKTLRTLISHQDFDQRYHPASQLRQPKTWERGYWRIDTTSWSAQTQLVFWKFMEGFVGQGKAGIGTTCVRNMLDDGSVEAGPRAHLGVIRIYCWGELAKPLFLLAQLGSKGYTKKVGAQWISAATGETIIHMP